MRVPRRRSDAELLVASAEDPEAFGEFYDRHLAAVLAFFRRRVLEPEVALDLAAETFASALLSLRSFDPERGEPLGWLFAIARHKLVDAVRAGYVDDRTRRAIAMQPIVVDDEAAAAIERLAAEGARELLRALPRDQCAAVFARYVEDLGYGEIAARLGCSESVVRKRVSRGLAALRGSTAFGEAMP